MADTSPISLWDAGLKIGFDLIEKHQIRCEATKVGTVHAAYAPSGFEGLKARQC